MICYLLYLFFRSFYEGLGLKWFFAMLLDFIIALIVVLAMVAWLLE